MHFRNRCFLHAIILDVVKKIRSDAKMQWGGIYLIEFCVDDFGVLVPVVDVDPHLYVSFGYYTYAYYKNGGRRKGLLE